MILVVADTSPLVYLVQIGCEDVLPVLFDVVLVPEAVIQELEDLQTPANVRAWLRAGPRWLEVRQISLSGSSALAGLDAGEAEAIQLAKFEHADLLLIDERRGVGVAQRQGLEVTGTLGVLLQAARRKLIVLDEALARLQATNFRCTPRLLEEVRKSARKKPL